MRAFLVAVGLIALAVLLPVASADIIVDGRAVCDNIPTNYPHVPTFQGRRETEALGNDLNDLRSVCYRNMPLNLA